MTLNEVITQLYSANVDCGVESYRGSGVVGWIVDAGNRRVERHFGINELDTIGDWLREEAIRQHESDTSGSRTRSLLEELVGSRRKDPKRVTHSERHDKQRDVGHADRTAG